MHGSIKLTLHSKWSTFAPQLQLYIHDIFIRGSYPPDTVGPWLMRGYAPRQVPLRQGNAVNCTRADISCALQSFEDNGQNPRGQNMTEKAMPKIIPRRTG